MEITQMKENKFVKKYLPFLAAFLIPVLILLVIFIMRGVYPIGDRMFFRSDMYHQYGPMLKLFQETLKSGGSLQFNWNIGLGADFMSTYAYYLASPVNWLLAILPSGYIPEIMGVFIIFKTGLMSLFFSYYVSKRTGKTNFFCTVFGVFYALSSYTAAYCWNVMWLDCLVLLPLIVLGLERLVKEGKGLLYCITLGISILSNYYISIMIAFFLIFYFLYLMISENKIEGFINILKRIGLFAGYSFMGGAIGAVCVIPALLTLLGTSSADSPFPATIQAYYNVMEFLSQGTMNHEVSALKGNIPNIYCTLLAFSLVLLFWFSKKISLRQKIGRTLLLAIFIFSFTFDVPAYIWHGFHFPNSLPARHSFIYIFLVLVICCEVMTDIKEYSTKAILISFGVAVLTIVVIMILYPVEHYMLSTVALNTGFIIVYYILCMLMKEKSVPAVLITVLFCVVAVAEAFINTNATGYSVTSRIKYMNDNKAIQELTGGIDDAGFYRVDKIQRLTKNDGAWNGYNSATTFLSTTPKALTVFYKTFGMNNNKNEYIFYGYTPVMSALLNVRYLLYNDVNRESWEPNAAQNDHLLSRADSRLTDNHTEEILFKYDFDGSLGYLVNEDFEDSFEEADNPLDSQNNLLKSAVGADIVFDTTNQLYGDVISYTADKDARIFVYAKEKLYDLMMRKFRDSENIQTTIFPGMNGEIIDIGDVKKGDTLVFKTDDRENSSFNLVIGVMDYDSYDNAIDLLTEQKMNVIEYSGNYVKASVNVTDDERTKLFTSIPYGKGWSAYVDGKKTDCGNFMGAFVTLALSSGEHIVEFRYESPGLLLGGIISGVAILLLAILTICKRHPFLRSPLNRV